MRKIAKLARVVAFSLLAFVFVLVVRYRLTADRFGQVSPKPSVGSTEVSDEKQRVIQALDFLGGLAEKATLAEVQVDSYAAIGQLLWEVDRDRARAYFRLAAEKIDRLRPGPEEQLDWRSGRPEERLRERKRELRSSLLEIVSVLDSELAQEISRGDASGSRSPQSGSVITEGSETGASRGEKSETEQSRRSLSLSGEEDVLLQGAGAVIPVDPGRAAAMAEESFRRQVTLRSMDFLLTLRHYDRAAADRLFEQTLTRLAGNPQVDISSLAVLGMYLVARDSSSAPRPEVVRRYVELLASGLVQAAARISQLPPVEQEKVRFAHMMATSFVQPFGSYGADVAQTLQSAVAQAGATLSGGRTAQARPPSSPVASGEYVPPVESSAERAVVQALTKKDFASARSLIDRISDPERRHLRLVQWTREVAEAALETGDTDGALRYVRTLEGEVDRAGLLVEIARRLAEQKQTDSALAILNEALSLAERQEASVGKAEVLVKISQALVGLEPLRAFQVATALVTTLNRVWAAFPSDYQAYRALEDTRGQSESLFFALGRVDFDQALGLAHQLDNLNLRVPLGVAVCKGAWQRLVTETKKTESEAQPGSTETPSGQKQKKRSANESPPPGSSPRVRPPTTPPRK